MVHEGGVGDQTGHLGGDAQHGLQVLERIDPTHRNHGPVAWEGRCVAGRDAHAVDDRSDPLGLHAEGALPRCVEPRDRCHHVGCSIGAACQTTRETGGEHPLGLGGVGTAPGQVGLAYVDTVLGEHHGCAVESLVHHRRNSGPASRGDVHHVDGWCGCGGGVRDPPDGAVELGGLASVQIRKRASVGVVLPAEAVELLVPVHPGRSRCERSRAGPGVLPTPDQSSLQLIEVTLPRQQAPEQGGGQPGPGGLAAGQVHAGLLLPHQQRWQHRSVAGHVVEGTLGSGGCEQSQDRPVDLRKARDQLVAARAHPAHRIRIGALGDHQDVDAALAHDKPTTSGVSSPTVVHADRVPPQGSPHSPASTSMSAIVRGTSTGAPSTSTVTSLPCR